MTSAFQLRLLMHTPMILPRVAPRLDTLLAEGLRRLRLDWESPLGDLPLTFDEAEGGYRASQVIFGITPSQGLEAHDVKFASSVTRMPTERASNAKRTIKLDGGGTAPKVTSRSGYLAPYMIFYGEGDPQACVELLGFLGGIGLEHARGQGFFTVESVTPDTTEGWRQRPWRTSSLHEGRGYTAIPDYLRMNIDGESESVFRPPRVIKEAVA